MRYDPSGSRTRLWSFSLLRTAVWDDLIGGEIVKTDIASILTHWFGETHRLLEFLVLGVHGEK